LAIRLQLAKNEHDESAGSSRARENFAIFEKTRAEIAFSNQRERVEPSAPLGPVALIDQKEALNGTSISPHFKRANTIIETLTLMNAAAQRAL
jgi:hypothetical protein